MPDRLIGDKMLPPPPANPDPFWAALERIETRCHILEQSLAEVAEALSNIEDALGYTVTEAGLEALNQATGEDS